MVSACREPEAQRRGGSRTESSGETGCGTLVSFSLLVLIFFELFLRIAERFFQQLKPLLYRQLGLMVSACREPEAQRRGGSRTESSGETGCGTGQKPRRCASGSLQAETMRPKSGLFFSPGLDIF
jgi:hypothetical protein